jgi:hypothetical protein
MSWPLVWYKDPSNGLMSRSFRNCVYDPVAETFTFDDSYAMSRMKHEHPELFVGGAAPEPIRLTISKEQVVCTNSEGREHWKLTDVPCKPDGFGSDIKAYDLVQEMKKEIEAVDPKPQRYVEWRAKFIADYERDGPTLEELKAAYPAINRTW